MDNREERIRQKAHQLWEQAGRPDHKDAEHWAEAERLIEREDHKGDADKLANEPSPRRPNPPSPSPRGEAVDIGPAPGGDIQTIPAATGTTKRRRG
jgi:hypothetical protein